MTDARPRGRRRLMMAVGLLVAAAVIGIAVGKTADAQTHRAAAARSHPAATMDMSGMITASSRSETRCASCGSSTSPGRGSRS